MASRGEKALLITTIPANVVTVTASAAPSLLHLPDKTRPWVIAISGTLLLLLAWKFITEKKAKQARYGMFVGIAAATAFAVALSWPSSSSPLTAGDASHQIVVSAAAKLAPTIQPAPNSMIGTCTSVSGSGTIPNGYEIWVANLNGTSGLPDTSEFFNLREAKQTFGSSSWYTTPFAVGEANATGNQYWIYVMLVPESAGSVLQNVELPPGWGVSLRAAISGATLVAKIPVVRGAAQTC